MPATFKKLKRGYHFLWAWFSALWCGFPSRRLFVVGVTGTKGKTTTVELINAILETAGRQTVLASTLRFKVNRDSKRNFLKMTTPGRGFLQKLLARGVRAGCQYAVLEMTSEGAEQFRHRFIELDTLIFTNLAPEHIESHGSYQNYRAAKLEIGRQLERSKKTGKTIIANGDDPEAPKFLALKTANKIRFSAKNPPPEAAASRLPGAFNRGNVLAAVAFARSRGISPEIVRRALQNFRGVPGRMEKIVEKPFEVIVDYAHTPDSLRLVYEAFPRRRKICVLGGTGGGRDRWKRPVMGRIAAEYCHSVILTDEDPYDEGPEQIVAEIARGISKPIYQIILDRREAIREALRQAQPADAVIITGKGTDPYIMGPGGTKTPWDDATVVREEFKKMQA